MCLGLYRFDTKLKEVELKLVKITKYLSDGNSWPMFVVFFPPLLYFFSVIGLYFCFPSCRRTSVYKSSSRWCRRNAMFPAPLDNKSSKWVNKCIITPTTGLIIKAVGLRVWPNVSSDSELWHNSLCVFWCSHDAVTTTTEETASCVVTTGVAQMLRYRNGNRLLLVRREPTSLFSFFF